LAVLLFIRVAEAEVVEAPLVVLVAMVSVLTEQLVVLFQQALQQIPLLVVVVVVAVLLHLDQLAVQESFISVEELKVMH
jgi:hypothetical protein